MRHCKALFRKQVFPVLLSPQPTVDDGGHVRSMARVYRDFTGPEDACGAADDCEGDGVWGVRASEDCCDCSACVRDTQGKERRALTFLGGVAVAPLIGWYFPFPMANVPEDDPSKNSTAGGSMALKVSTSFAGRYWAESRSRFSEKVAAE